MQSLPIRAAYSALEMPMLKAIHHAGSAVRHSRLLKNQRWLWNAIQPAWNAMLEAATSRRGFSAVINGDAMRLEYEIGARYARTGYEPVFYRNFVDRIRPGMTVFDVGAHVGIFTLGAALRVGKSGCVFAFEPAPDTVDMLRRHVRMNGMDDVIEVVPSIVSDADGKATFYAHGLSMAASMSQSNTVDLNPERPERAATLDLTSMARDTFCETRGISPDVIKIDVEGAEYLALKGAERLLGAGRPSPVILCEVHPVHMKNCGGSLADFEQYLSRLGYTASRLDEPNPMGIHHVA